MTEPAGVPLTASSARVKAARRLARRRARGEERLFLVEGPQAVREALTVPGCVREVFALPTVTPLANPGGAPWRPVDERAFSSLAESVSPQGVVAVCAFVDRPLEELLGNRPRLVAVCAEVRDPGNAGTVIRCADAAGADGVVVAGHSVDPYNGKVVRASVGSLFHLPLVVDDDPVSVVRRLKDAGLQVLAADGAGETDLDDAIDERLLEPPTAWLFGNEARGLADDLAGLADRRVRIPLHGRAESLNLATAAAVCLYASARAQRRAARAD